MVPQPSFLIRTDGMISVGSDGRIDFSHRPASIHSARIQTDKDRNNFNGMVEMRAFPEAKPWLELLVRVISQQNCVPKGKTGQYRLRAIATSLRGSDGSIGEAVPYGRIPGKSVFFVPSIRPDRIPVQQREAGMNFLKLWPEPARLPDARFWCGLATVWPNRRTSK